MGVHHLESVEISVFGRRGLWKEGLLYLVQLLFKIIFVKIFFFPLFLNGHHIAGWPGLEVD